MKVKEESEKVGLYLAYNCQGRLEFSGIRKLCLVFLKLRDEETVKTVRDFIFRGSKITADGD